MYRDSDKKCQCTGVENKPGHVRLVGDGLRKLMGDVTLCREEELTRAVLLEFLTNRRETSRR